MTTLTDALAWYGQSQNRNIIPILEAARLVDNLPDFPGFDRWYDALVVRKVDYIDEYRDTDDGLIDWIAAVLAFTPPPDTE